MRLLLVSIASYLGASYALSVSRPVLPTPALPPLAYRPITPKLNIPEHIQHDWAAYAPYTPVAPYIPPPPSCALTQVNILERHGARYPTKSASKAIEAAVEKLFSVQEYTSSRLDFVKNFTYDLGTDDLVPFGAAQSFDAGQEAYTRYANLISEDDLPFVRASSKSRVVQSATNWTAGFAWASDQTYAPVLSVILSESGNDTLDDAMCPNAGNADAQMAEWLAVYAPNITAQLNAWAPGANLSDSDMASLTSLCPFETVAHETASPFCALFESLGAFPGYAYNSDLKKYYGTGYGQALGRVQGVGYVNELLARLTDTPVQDSTQTNSTLDADPATFPLGRALYADFTHDNEMVAIYGALGLFAQPAPLDPAAPAARRSWRTWRMVPFAGRMVAERVACGGDGAAFVRILVNEAVQPLPFCGAGADGLCSLDAFVESQAYARSGGDGDWAQCFA